ncbi:MAG: YgcG family protein [Rhodoferax sp.]|nr:YgcG family protein [Rhodoferax sp.]
MAQVAVPPLVGHVTDQTGTLSAAQQAALEQTLRAFEARKGSQLAVLLVPTTAPEDIEQYALRVAEQWKLGRAKVDDGAILVVAKNDRTLRLEVGYGLEGALSDITSKRIVSDTIVPRFKQGDYYGGIDAGVAQIIRVIDGEPLPPPQRAAANPFDQVRHMAPFLMVAALVVGGVLRSALGKLPGSLLTGVLVGAVAWFLIGAVLWAALAGLAAVVATLLGSSAGLRGVGGLAGGGRGGFGGGGFRGGGGGFGGGGASGRW